MNSAMINEFMVVVDVAGSKALCFHNSGQSVYGAMATQYRTSIVSVGGKVWTAATIVHGAIPEQTNDFSRYPFTARWRLA